MKKVISIIAVSVMTIAPTWTIVAEGAPGQRQFHYPVHHIVCQTPAPPYPAPNTVSYPVPAPIPVPVFYPVPLQVSVYATRCVAPGVGWVWMNPGVIIPVGGGCTAFDSFGRPWAGVAQ